MSYTPQEPFKRDIKYECEGADHTGARNVGRENLVAKTVSFRTVGKTYQTIKSRTVAWLCRECAASDPAWTQEPLGGSAGFRDTKLNTHSK